MDDARSLIQRGEGHEFTFEEAVEFFGDRLPVTAEQFRKLSEKYRSLAFTVSGYTGTQILKRFQDELLKAIEDGDTLRSFRDRMNSFLESKGYGGLTNFQADNIFRTNTQTAYQAGHYAQMTEPGVLSLRPYWMYVAVDDRLTRPSHLAMNGFVARADDPIWDTWFPPNGYRCRCTVVSLTARQVAEQGLKVYDEVPDRMALPDGRLAYVAPDPSFRTNPGKTRFDPDFKDYPPALVNAYERRQNAGSPTEGPSGPTAAGKALG